jgi:hypothetical protein
MSSRPCGDCGGTGPEGCQCVGQDSDTIDLSGAATAGSPWQWDVILDPAADNLLSASAAGLLADLPAELQVVPACRVSHNVDQSITNNTATVLAFNLERYDTDTMHSTVTDNSRITINTAGVYVVTANILFEGNATGARHVELRLNGTTIIGYVVATPTGTVGQRVEVTTQWKFAATDYVEVRVTQTSGGALNVQTAAEYSPEFMAVRVAAG